MVVLCVKNITPLDLYSSTGTFFAAPAEMHSRRGNGLCFLIGHQHSSLLGHYGEGAKTVPRVATGEPPQILSDSLLKQ